jgi:hypothetical protein
MSSFKTPLVVGAVFAVLFFFSCSPCARVSNAEAAIADRGRDCNAGQSTWDAARVSRCESELSKCSPDDLKKVDEYIRCLDGIPACSDSSKATSFAVARLECVGKLTGISLQCGSAAQ